MTRVGIGINKLYQRSIVWLDQKSPLEKKLIIGAGSLVLGVIGIKLIAAAWVNYQTIHVAIYLWNLPLKYAITPLAIEGAKAATGITLSAISLKGLQIVITKGQKAQEVSVDL